MVGARGPGTSGSSTLSPPKCFGGREEWHADPRSKGEALESVRPDGIGSGAWEVDAFISNRGKNRANVCAFAPRPGREGKVQGGPPEVARGQIPRLRGYHA